MFVYVKCSTLLLILFCIMSWNWKNFCSGITLLVVSSLSMLFSFMKRNHFVNLCISELDIQFSFLYDDGIFRPYLFKILQSFYVVKHFFFALYSHNLQFSTFLFLCSFFLFTTDMKHTKQHWKKFQLHGYPDWLRLLPTMILY